VQYDPHGQSIITQYEMHAVEDAGLLKFDFLGLKNLSVLGDAVERVEKRKGEKVDIENIPLDDEKVFAMLARGETEGVFQLGGSGVTHFLKDLKPTSIHDINAMVALYRPGPMESIPAYIQRKHNPALIEHIDPRMKDLLERSYGIITYQDDVLLTAITLAGYSWLEADNLRKAMGKKIPAEMEAQKEKFINGCISYGKLTRYKADSIWKLIEPFRAF
jgi:DNA polymerase-3 subunit alpha